MSSALQSIFLVVILSIGANVPLYFMLRDPFARIGRTMPVPTVIYQLHTITINDDWRGMY